MNLEVMANEVAHLKVEIETIKRDYVRNEVVAVITRDLDRAINTVSLLLKGGWLLAGAGATLWLLSGGPAELLGILK